MATSSSFLSATLTPLPLCNSSFSQRPKPSISFPIKSPKLLGPIVSRPLSSRVFAAPELLGPQDVDAPQDSAGAEVPDPSLLASEAGVDKMAPKQKIRIKLRSYWVPLIEDSCKQIMDAARNTNAKTMGPVPLPTKKRVYCVLKSPHVHKDARFHFEIRTHQRLIDILYPTAQTIDSLMQLDLPAGVDVEVKL
ncbi:small ribosomal subunit protein uS10c [Typha angustifolia]|uniref:small ribosomal subunit protein uS10c n=1 Tax=Typha angustifolia TaxID=59011 RepID=UPI003C3045B8